MLPRGQIGPSLLVAARILGCSPQEFAQIQALPLTGTHPLQSLESLHQVSAWLSMIGMTGLLQYD